VAAPASRNVIEVRVELKPGVLDAEADSVHKSLGLLGVGPIAAVRTARVYVLEFGDVDAPTAERLAHEAVERLLANPIIHRVRLTAVSV
jgi:phosphoribosylformylglycinamidine synthase PurS subunit